MDNFRLTKRMMVSDIEKTFDVLGTFYCKDEDFITTIVGIES